MASEKDHLAKAAHNEKFLAVIPEGFADWKAIAAFYVAVHLVEAFFATQQRHSRGHRRRNLFLKKHHRSIYKHFYALYNYSLFVRYDCDKVDREHVCDVLVDARLPALKKALDAIRNPTVSVPNT